MDKKIVTIRKFHILKFSFLVALFSFLSGVLFDLPFLAIIQLSRDLTLYSHGGMNLLFFPPFLGVTGFFGGFIFCLLYNSLAKYISRIRIKATIEELV
jgi:hypothetical protein